MKVQLQPLFLGLMLFFNGQLSAMESQSSKEMQTLKIKAKKGNQKAMRSLALHYLADKEYEKGISWLNRFNICVGVDSSFVADPRTIKILQYTSLFLDIKEREIDLTKQLSNKEKVYTKFLKDLDWIKKHLSILDHPSWIHEGVKTKHTFDMKKIGKSRKKIFKDYEKRIIKHVKKEYKNL
jgi:hypothetical protein